MNPSTLQFGPWMPDLANNGLPVGWPPSLGTVPLVDLLNVYWADANYVCQPGPVNTGPALSAAVLNAFTWYDNTGGKEIVFAATAQGINSLIDGAWSTVPVVGASSVSVTGFDLFVTLAGFQPAQGLEMVTTLGDITISNVPNVTAQVQGGFATGSAPTHIFTLVVTVTGGTATAWSWSTDNGVLSSTTAQNPTLTMHLNQIANVNCTVTVNGMSIVATPNTYEYDSFS
jgi:hypothetical protein